ncbi:unnamed protein product, partial [Polarella glacialis]
SGSDCHAERDRAVKAEDMLILSRTRADGERQDLERQVAELRALLSGPGGGGGGNSKSGVTSHLQVEVDSLRRENEALKARLGGGGSLPSVAEERQLALGAGGPSAGPAPPSLRGAGARGPMSEDLLRSLAANGAIGVAVIVCKRPKYLKRAMDSILQSERDPAKFPLVISQDGYDPDMTQMVQSTFVSSGQAFHMHHPHDPNAQTVANKFGGSKQTLGYVYIAQHFGFVMRRMFDEFGFSAVIFLEEDLEVSPDFFSYFGAMRELL